MSRISVAMVIIACAWSSLSTAQSLGDVAKRERERREKNKERGVAVREIAAEEIFDEDGSASEVSGSDEETEASADATSAESQFDLPLLPSDEGVEDPDRERNERRRQEAEWRSRVAEAKTRIAQARARKEQLDGLFLGEGQRYEDTNGRVVIRSRAHLQELVAEATEELRAAEEALAALLEEARRAGVPPGWLR